MLLIIVVGVGLEVYIREDQRFFKRLVNNVIDAFGAGIVPIAQVDFNTMVEALETLNRDRASYDRICQIMAEGRRVNPRGIGLYTLYTIVQNSMEAFYNALLPHVTNGTLNQYITLDIVNSLNQSQKGLFFEYLSSAFPNLDLRIYHP